VQIHLRRSYHYSTTTAPTNHNHQLHYSYDEPTIKSCPVQIDGLSTGALRPRQGSSLVCRVVGFWCWQRHDMRRQTRSTRAIQRDGSDGRRHHCHRHIPPDPGASPGGSPGGERWEEERACTDRTVMREVNDDDNNVCMYDAKEGCGGCDATPLGPCPDAVPLAYASLSGFLGITFCGTRNQDFGGSTTKILVPLTINPITTTTTTTTLLIVNLYIPIRQS